MQQRNLNLAYLLLGSNIDPEANLPAAVQALSRWGTVLAVSDVWESKPVGFADQPNFLNAAVLLQTPLGVVDLRNGPVVEIERQLHRVRDPDNVNGPRTIDVDVVLFNRDTGRFGRLHLPDPEIAKHAFMAVPLSQIAPEYVLPEDGRNLAEIAAALEGASEDLTKRSNVRLTASPLE